MGQWETAYVERLSQGNTCIYTSVCRHWDMFCREMQGNSLGSVEVWGLGFGAFGFQGLWMDETLRHLDFPIHFTDKYLCVGYMG